MTPERKMLARALFQLRIRGSEGFAFENLFGQVMEYSRPGFQKIRPYGNQGDRGNDAYERITGRYYQVFAPQNPAEKVAAAIKKAKEDFATKLLPHWGNFCPANSYVFVFNDKYTGSIFDIEQTLAEIKSTYNLIDASVFLSKDLEDEFINLDEDKILMVINGIPNIDSTEPLDYSALGQVIDHILKAPLDYTPSSKLTTPNFDEKISFNELNSYGDCLKFKFREAWQVDDYLSRNSNFAKQALRDKLSGYYQESIQKIASSANGVSLGDLRFAYIFEKLAPATSNPYSDKLRADAAFVLMSKYFETCDIFEEPENVASS